MENHVFSISSNGRAAWRSQAVAVAGGEQRAVLCIRARHAVVADRVRDVVQSSIVAVAAEEQDVASVGEAAQAGRLDQRAVGGGLRNQLGSATGQREAVGRNRLQEDRSRRHVVGVGVAARTAGPQGVAVDLVNDPVLTRCGVFEAGGIDRATLAQWTDPAAVSHWRIWSLDVAAGRSA